MNTLIISTFSCTFEEFKNDVTTLFLEEMCKDFVTDYEFVKVKSVWKKVILKDAVNGAAVPIHPGAAKYYKEQGVM